MTDTEPDETPRKATPPPKRGVNRKPPHPRKSRPPPRFPPHLSPAVPKPTRPKKPNTKPPKPRHWAIHACRNSAPRPTTQRRKKKPAKRCEPTTKRSSTACRSSTRASKIMSATWKPRCSAASGSKPGRAFPTSRFSEDAGGPNKPPLLEQSPHGWLTPYRFSTISHASRTRRGSQVVRQSSAKALFAGSIPAPASSAQTEELTQKYAALDGVFQNESENTSADFMDVFRRSGMSCRFVDAHSRL